MPHCQLAIWHCHRVALLAIWQSRQEKIAGNLAIAQKYPLLIRQAFSHWQSDVEFATDGYNAPWQRNL